MLVASKETVTVHVGVHGLFVKVAVTPAGSPDAENVIADPVPLVRVAVMEDEELLLPCVTVRLPGVGVERLKSKGGAETVSERVVVWLAPPPAAVMVTVACPRVAPLVAENETVTVHVGPHGLLVKLAVTPLGRPVAENVTGTGLPVEIVAVIDDE